MTANASWYDDKLEMFVVSGYYMHNTKAREKEDDTSASINIVSTDPTGCKTTVRVYGNYSDSSDGGTDQTVGTPKVVGASNYYTYLPNYVWENMKKDSSGHIHDHIYAYLCLTPNTNPQGEPEFYIAEGYWSPDSI